MKFFYFLLFCMAFNMVNSMEVEERVRKIEPIKDSVQNKKTPLDIQKNIKKANNFNEPKPEPFTIEKLGQDLYKNLSQERKQKFINKFDNLKNVDRRIQDLILGNNPESIDNKLIEDIKSAIKTEENYSRLLGKRSQHFIDALKKALDKATNIKSPTNTKQNSFKPNIADRTTHQQKLDNKQQEEREKAKKTNKSSQSISFDQPAQPTKPSVSIQDTKATKELLKNLIFNTELTYLILDQEDKQYHPTDKTKYNENYLSKRKITYNNPLEDNSDIKKLEQSLQKNNPIEQKKAFKSFIDTLTALKETNIEEKTNINNQITLLRYGQNGVSPKQLSQEEEQKLNTLNEQENRTNALTSFIDNKISEINKKYPKLKETLEKSETKITAKKESTPQETKFTEPQEKTPEEKLKDLETERDKLIKEKETLKTNRTTLETKLNAEQTKLSQISSASTPKNNKEREAINKKIGELKDNIKSIDQKIYQNTTKTSSLSQKIEDATDNKNKPDLEDEVIDYTGSAW